MVDFFLLLLVFFNAWQGWRQGFVLELISLLRWAGSLLLALRFYSFVARWLGHVTNWPEEWQRPLAFLLVLIIANLLLYWLAIQVLRRLPQTVHQHRANRWLGLFPGFASGLILTAILAPFLLALPLPAWLSTPARESRLANRLALFSDRLETALSPLLDDAMRTLNRRLVPPESSARLALPFKATNAKPRPDLEAEILVLVNQERQAVGLSPLAPDPELTAVARQHSDDMLTRSYFSHYTPEGASPFDRLRAAGVRFLAAGENLALAPTLQIAHDGLMQSPGHRANILRPTFGRVGIGILDAGRYGLMVTQKFRN
ncbi:MAG TPA: CvpA family protein [Blastocatellia bacterium]|nr:CvpA family protein [Blastocatellia bacterium]